MSEYNDFDVMIFNAYLMKYHNKNTIAIEDGDEEQIIKTFKKILNHVKKYLDLLPDGVKEQIRYPTYSTLKGVKEDISEEDYNNYKKFFDEKFLQR